MSRLRNLAQNTSLVVVSILLVLFVFEVFLRVRKGELTQTDNLLFKAHNFQPDRLSVGYPEQFDPDLGWVPKPSHRSVDRSSGSPIQTLEHGIRSHGHSPIKSPNRIMTLGDSFTWGEQVADNETWPFYLQQQTHWEVINAGVSGYGIDQAILRGEKLFKVLKPKYVILSFIANDIIRCGWSKSWGMQKPFFQLTQEGLSLKNVPVPQHAVQRPQLDAIRAILGKSYLANAIMIRINPGFWLSGLGYTFEKAEPNYEQVACRLLKRLKEAGKKFKFKPLIVAQYEENLSVNDISLTKSLIDCASSLGLETLDLLPLMEEMKKQGDSEYRSFIQWHHTPKGNQLVADEIARTFFNKNN